MPDEPRRDEHIHWDDHFFGSVTVGERGQVVIPASARKLFNIEPGDKLLIMGDPGKRGLMLGKIEHLQGFLSALSEGLARAVNESEELQIAHNATHEEETHRENE